MKAWITSLQSMKDTMGLDFRKLLNWKNLAPTTAFICLPNVKLLSVVLFFLFFVFCKGHLEIIQRAKTTFKGRIRLRRASSTSVFCWFRFRKYNFVWNWGCGILFEGKIDLWVICITDDSHWDTFSLKFSLKIYPNGTRKSEEYWT